MSQRRVTSADVARAAGVSRATVSYVLNDTPRQTISPATRDRVMAAAAELGYAPSAAARTLRTGRSEVVLCLLPDWPIGPEVGALIGGLSTELARHGLTLVVHPGNREERPIGDLWKTITPAAVIAFAGFSAEETDAMRAAGVAQVVSLLGRESGGGRGADGGREPASGRESGSGREAGGHQNGGREPGGRGGRELPQHLVGRRQVEHLASAGHTILGYAWPDDDRLRIFAEPRLAGVRAACHREGLAGPAIETVALDEEKAADAVRAWTARGVTAVCAYNDEVALAVLAGVRRSGLRVPDDLAVIGVDDIPSARLAAPPLTTVTTDQRLVAAHLSATVVAALDGDPEPALDPSGLVTVTVRASA